MLYPPQFPQQPAASSNFRLALKDFAIAGLTVVILIALFLIGNVIDSRHGYRDEAAKSIAESYASSQTLTGPILVRPFTVTTHTAYTDDQGHKQTGVHTREGTSWSFPHELNITGTVFPSERRHGLYKVPVYELNSHIAGTVDVADAVLQSGETAQDVTYSTK